MSGILSFIKRVCVQRAVYWGAPEADGFGGYSFSEPKEVSVRWDDKTERVTDSNGNEIVSRAEIMVTEDVDEGGCLYLGELDSLSEGEKANPQSVEGAFLIKRVDRSPLYRSTNKFVRTVYL